MKSRSIASVILLSIITCGIYSLYWFIATTNEIESEIEPKGESCTSGGLAFLLTIVTCGIYMFYWYYKQGQRISKLQAQVGNAPKDNSVLYLVLAILGLAIVSDVLIQDELNVYLEKKNAL
ncbi:MAG: DUF4234 domain-containing protein [Clostridiales bacterium]|jgi:drug/metabolite transporter (DMT)-like permease|nr:DUF4234 domain-containing protein [Clostridiales bacterium]